MRFRIPLKKWRCFEMTNCARTHGNTMKDRKRMKGARLNKGPNVSRRQFGSREFLEEKQTTM